MMITCGYRNLQGRRFPGPFVHCKNSIETSYGCVDLTRWSWVATGDLVVYLLGTGAMLVSSGWQSSCQRRIERIVYVLRP